MWQYGPMTAATCPQFLTVRTKVWYQWIKWYDFFENMNPGWRCERSRVTLYVRTYVRLPFLFQAVPIYVVLWKVGEVLAISRPEKVELSVCPLSDFWKSFDFWKVSRLCPLVLMVRATCRWRLGWTVGGMILAGKRSTVREVWPIGTFSGYMD